MIATFPWLNIGLRVLDDAGDSIRRDEEDQSEPLVVPVPPHPLKPKMFFESLVSLSSGRARDEIEGMLSTFVPRSFTIRQAMSETAGPENLLAFQQFDDCRVEAMYHYGKVAAQRAFSRVDFRLPGDEERQRVVGLLRTMAERSWAVLRGESNKESVEDVFLANVYLPNQATLRPWCSWNTAGVPDDEATFELGSGLIGFCHVQRRPLLANLKTIVDQHAKGDVDAIRFFRLNSADGERIAASRRSWQACFPVFDPSEISLHMTPVESIPPDRSYYSEIPTPIKAGTIFGVLSLEGTFDPESIGLHAEPASTLSDPRVASVIAMMQGVAFEVAQILSAVYPDQLPFEVGNHYS